MKYQKFIVKVPGHLKDHQFCRPSSKYGLCSYLSLCPCLSLCLCPQLEREQEQQQQENLRAPEFVKVRENLRRTSFHADEKEV